MKQSYRVTKVFFQMKKFAFSLPFYPRIRLSAG